MEDFKNAREVVCKECKDWNLNICNSCPVFLLWDKKKEQERRENLLIENACCIFEIYDLLLTEGKLDKDVIDYIDSLYQYRCFADWAREFEDDRVAEDNEDYLSAIKNFATEKILNEWGKDNE